MIAMLVSANAFAQAPNPPLLPKPTVTKDDPQVYNVTRNGLEMNVQYRGPRECALAFLQQAREEGWNKEEQAEQAAKVPPGGYLLGYWSRSTAALASAEHFTITVEAADGHPIVRWQSPVSKPEQLRLGTSILYTEVVTVHLPVPLADGDRVLVEESTVKKRFVFVIRL
ncbi:hypothetical protein SAMN04488069_10442 [Hymenobacter psychrophilus]|uniref:Uncharacterized protein n=2 Tax=Hymenobacter psychrophilus TaxID=651662 RepID=A0A1H3FFF7_9BACT|nr:hypothetical protein SAMN04488069_10442 [Hymenobacter psychrophilus]